MIEGDTLGSSAARTREWRRRLRAGRILLEIEADEAPLTVALVEAGLLAPELADQQAAIEAAVEKLLATLIHERDASPL